MPAPYAQVTLDNLTAQLGQQLDDVSAVYWTATEKQYAICEALRVWGSLTSYWRARGSFSLTSGQPFYDLSVQLPVLRPRTTTLDRLVQEIQYMLLEPASGISGAGSSGQVSITSILQSIQRARNRFVIDVHFPYTFGATPLQADADGLINLSSSCVYLHRAAWQDLTSGRWTNLWRQDAWAVDHSDPTWLQFPGSPLAYSESSLSPQQVQLSPAPAAVGQASLITVDSLSIDIGDPAALFHVPDEWMYAIKYAVLEDLLNTDSQINDPLRSQYAAMRYDQAVAAAQSARSITRVLLSNVVLPLDSLASLDAAWPAWRNQSDRPISAACQYDLVTFAAPPDQAYGVTLDVVQAAPIPLVGTDFIQIGYEDIAHILDYCTHMLLFKCGGNEFKSGFTDYDAFMKAVEQRGQITKAKIMYTDAVFGQPDKDQRERPDAKPKGAAAA